MSEWNRERTRDRLTPGEIFRVYWFTREERRYIDQAIMWCHTGHVRYMREQAGLGVRELAEAVTRQMKCTRVIRPCRQARSVSAATLCRWERGKVKKPTDEIALALYCVVSDMIFAAMHDLDEELEAAVRTALGG
jgi:hypothetical protein